MPPTVASWVGRWTGGVWGVNCHSSSNGQRDLYYVRVLQYLGSSGLPLNYRGLPGATSSLPVKDKPHPAPLNARPTSNFVSANPLVPFLTTATVYGIPNHHRHGRHVPRGLKMDLRDSHGLGQPKCCRPRPPVSFGPRFIRLLFCLVPSPPLLFLQPCQPCAKRMEPGRLYKELFWAIQSRADARHPDSPNEFSIPFLTPSPGDPGYLWLLHKQHTLHLIRSAGKGIIIILLLCSGIFGPRLITT